MSSEHDQGTTRSVLAWESVLDSDDVSPASLAPTPGQTSPGDEIELSMAPLSLDPLSLDPLPPIADGATGRQEADAPQPPGVLGDLHLHLDLFEPAPPVAPAPVRQPPAAAPRSPLDTVADDVLGEIELRIEPLDMPDLRPSGPVPAVEHAAPPQFTDVALPERPAPTVPAAEQQAPSVPSPIAEPHPAVAWVPTPAAEPSPGPAPAPAAEPAPATHRTAVPAAAPEVDQPRTPAAEPAPAPLATTTGDIPGLPTDPVPTDATPTTIIPGVFTDIAITGSSPSVVSAVAPSLGHVPTPNLPAQTSLRHADGAGGATTSRDEAMTQPKTKKEVKQQYKLQKQKDKYAAKAKPKAQKASKAQTQKSGGGGIALFFTLLVLVALIAGAIVFGRPYIFPDAWDADAKPYGEAVEAARGADIDEPLLIERRAADVYASTMTAHLVGDLTSQLPLWRSLGLVDGTLDEPLLRSLVAGWTDAFYDPATGNVIADEAVDPAELDAAITEAMVAAAVDQEQQWSESVAQAGPDDIALTTAAVTATSRMAAAATVYGAADDSDRQLDLAGRLPAIVAYQVLAASAFAEFAGDDPADFDALRQLTTVPLASEPEIAPDEAIVDSQIVTDRAFWYTVFGGYVDPASAYTGSNEIVQASVATIDRTGTQCTAATFSGMDISGALRLDDTLQKWVAAAPAALGASVRTLDTGTMQLMTCDPGGEFVSGARAGVGTEIMRLRMVELATIESLDPLTGAPVDRAAVIDVVRETQLGLTILDLPPTATAAETARVAREIVAGAAATLAGN